jgi:hypothetical protein
MRKILTPLVGLAAIYVLPFLVMPTAIPPPIASAWAGLCLAAAGIFLLREFAQARARHKIDQFRREWDDQLKAVQSKFPELSRPKNDNTKPSDEAGDIDEFPPWMFGTREEPQYPPASWLKSRMTTAELEKEYPWYREEGAFGSDIRLQEGDELWWFSSPEEQWNALAGRGGIAVIRDGKCIAHVVIIMS